MTETEDYGNIRVLPPGSPGLPERGFPPKREEDGSKDWLWANGCLSQLPAWLVDLPPVEGLIGYVCTRSKHDPDEVHVCHNYRNGEYYHDIVWGGE